MLYLLWLLHMHPLDTIFNLCLIPGLYILFSPNENTKWSAKNLRYSRKIKVRNFAILSMRFRLTRGCQCIVSLLDGTWGYTIRRVRYYQVSFICCNSPLNGLRMNFTGAKIPHNQLWSDAHPVDACWCGGLHIQGIATIARAWWCSRTQFSWWQSWKWKLHPSNTSFLSFRDVFHFHDSGRKGNW